MYQHGPSLSHLIINKTMKVTMKAWSLMYIDDLNIGEVHAMEKSKIHITQNKEQRTIHAKYCEEKLWPVLVTLVWL